MSYFKINEETKALFLAAINKMDASLKRYARKSDANADWVKERDKQIQDLFNYFKEAEQVIQDLNYNKKIESLFIINESSEVTALKAEVNRLKAKLRKYENNPWGYDVNNPNQREALRSISISQAREKYGF